MDFYQPEIISYTDYYPFGMVMAGRDSSLEKYRFGFNGKEIQAEIESSKSYLSFGDRIYNSRLGKWLSIDPLRMKYPDLSPYIFTADNPIKFIDYNGEDFGVKVDNTNKTIIVVENIYTTNWNAFKQAGEGAAQWNAKTTLVEGYTVSFQITIKEPTTISNEDVIKNYPLVKFYRNNGNLKKGRMSDYRNKMIKADAVASASRDPIGNLFSGNEGDRSERVYGEKFTGGQTANGKYIDMNTHEDRGDLGNYKDLVTHEIGHDLGLDDAGKGSYYSPGGIMQYGGLRLAPISDDDVKNIIRFAKDALKGNTTSTAPKVTLMENKGISDGKSPLDK